MTNLDLIEKFKDDPNSRLSSSYFRTFNGILFNRVPKGVLFNRVPKGVAYKSYYSESWYPIAIYDGDIGLMNHFDHYRMPDRHGIAVSNALRSIENQMVDTGKTVVSIAIDLELPSSMHQPLKLRGVPDRKKFIKDILDYYFSFTMPTRYSDYLNSGKLDSGVAEEEAYKVAWEYAITTFAANYVENKKTLEGSLNELCSGKDIQSLNQAILTLSNQVKDDDLGNCEDIFKDLRNCNTNLGYLITRINGRLNTTRGKCKELILSSPVYMEDTRRDLDKFYSGYYSPRYIMTIRNDNLLKGWGDFSSFISRLGFDIPKPFGLNLNAENVSTLAAFRDTSAESMINFTHHLDRIVEAQEAEANPKPSSNLYLA
jgi:hypothetical protein